MAKHWLLEWIDANGITTVAQAHSLFHDKTGAESLGRLSSEWDANKDLNSNEPLPSGIRAVVAGHPMDLSGSFACNHAECQLRLVETLLWKVWHYFDIIVVSGLSTWSATSFGGGPFNEQLVMEHVRLLLELRKAGLEPYLDFRDRPSYRALEAAAAEYWIMNERDEVAIRELADVSSIKIVESHGEAAVAFESPLSPNPLLHRLEPGEQPDLIEVARLFYQLYASSTKRDLSLARALGTPLAGGLLRQESGTSPGHALDEAVALNVKIPVLEGIPVAELVRLRQDLRPHFEVFRTALLAACREQASRLGSDDPRVVADAVRAEYLETSLSALEIKMRSAREKLLRKSTQSIVVGSALVSIGLIAAMPLVIASGVTAASSVLFHTKEYADDTTELKSSELYYLWAAKEQRVHHRDSEIPGR